jgi:hypothetical protein
MRQAIVLRRAVSSQQAVVTVAIQRDDRRRTKAPVVSGRLSYHCNQSEKRPFGERPSASALAAGAGRATAEEPAPEAPLGLRDFLHNDPLCFEIRFGSCGDVNPNKTG